ncbi:MAG: FkbM family methyltransferase [Ruminococcus sp.]|nr:FkbM family methyltransferase [Ruminococcus sp.]
MLTPEFIRALPSWSSSLRECKAQVYIYGTGDGCEKALEQLDAEGINVSGIFTSDDFTAKRSFHGFVLLTVSDIESVSEPVSVVCAFGTDIPEVMQRIERLAESRVLVYPDTAVIGTGAFGKTSLLERYDDYAAVYSMLSDDLSRRTLDNILCFKITGDIKYLSEYSEADDIYALLELGQNEYYADIGAYNGDTAEEFLRYTGGRYSHICLVEPSRRNFAKCLRNCAELDNITFINAAASNSDGIGHFSDGTGRQQSVCEHGEAVSLRSVDSIVGGRPCTYIKYDVEGSDRPALLGSAETIKLNRPKIRTGIYHRPYDILDIPLLVRDICPGYCFYIRRRRYYPAWDTELIALP